MAAIRREAGSQGSAHSGRDATLAAKLEPLRALDRELEALCEKIGRPPAQPPTPRGRFGGLCIGVLSRVFWWQTAPVKQFAEAQLNRNREQTRILNAWAQSCQESIRETANRLEQARALLESGLADYREEIAACDLRIREMELAQLKLQSDRLDYAAWSSNSLSRSAASSAVE